MHYCCLIVTEKFPTDEVIADILAPFEWGSDADPECQRVFTWDWWQVGGRYSGKLKLKIDEEDLTYNWQFYATVPRAGRLFRSKVLETIRTLYRTINNQHDIRPYSLYHEEDLYNELGYRDGYIRVDGALIRDLVDFEQYCDDCCCLVDIDKKAYSRLYEQEDFDQTVHNIFANGNRDNCYAVIVDLHD